MPAVRVWALVLLVGLGLCGCSEGPDASAEKPRHPNVLLIVFDEFGGDIMLGPNGKIDAGRYPNFAALARDGTWFRNAHTSYDSTTKAVPLILDGIAPRPGHLADRARPPAFDLHRARQARLPDRHLGGGNGHVPAALLPVGECEPAGDHPEPEGRARRALRRFRPLDQGQPAADAVGEARPAAARAVGVHAVRAGCPGRWDPSSCRGCRRCRASTTLTSATTTSSASCSSWASPTACSGAAIARLKSQGIYDDTLIVVTADHGFAWKVGVETRRSVESANVDELGPVPLIVKRPGQHRARVSPALARTLDVTPTIADVLNVPLGYRADGRSAFSRAVRARRTVRIVKRDFSSVVELAAEHLARAPGRRRTPALSASSARATGRASSPPTARTGT